MTEPETKPEPVTLEIQNLKIQIQDTNLPVEPAEEPANA